MAKKRRAPTPSPRPSPSGRGSDEAQPAPGGKDAHRFAGGVTLWGEVVEEDGTHIHFRVLGDLEDAKTMHLSGQHWFAKRQLFARGHVDRLDYIRISYPLAALKATRAQPG